MPAYKNRPHIDPDTTVWRYMCLDAVVSTLRDRKLRLTRVDTFRDPFEGSVPKQQIDDQVVLFSHTYRNRATWSVIAQSYPPGEIYVPHDWGEDPWIRMTRLRRARTRSIHASCWSWGEESEALWRLYCTHDGASGIGIAVRTTLARLEASVAAHDLYVSPIRYRHYHEGPTFNDEIDPFMHKRMGFAAEQDVRLLKVDERQFNALISKPPTVAELAEHLFIDWAAPDVLAEIVLSPYADEPYEERARATIEAIDPALLPRIGLSILNPRRYAPGF